MINKEQIDIIIFESQATVHELLKELEEEEADSGESETYG